MAMANSGWHHSKQTKKILSDKNKGKFSGENNPMYGKHHTEETKRKLSESAKQRDMHANNPMRGKNHTEEARRKMSERWTDERRTKLISSQSRRYICEETEMVFKSQKDIASFLGYSESSISRALKQDKPIKGFHFRQLETVEENIYGNEISESNP